jgi:hypothetical protein
MFTRLHDAAGTDANRRDQARNKRSIHILISSLQRIEEVFFFYTSLRKRYFQG